MRARVSDAQMLMTVPYVLVTYLQHLAAPFYLSLLYGKSFVTGATDLTFLLPAVILLGLLIALWVYRRRVVQEVWVALAMMLAPLLPVLNLKVFHQEYIVQDRYLYLSSIGFCYLVSILIVHLMRRKERAALILSASIIISFGASTVLQNRVWHDAFAVWRRSAWYAPNSWSVHYNLGLAHLQRRQYEAARDEFMRATDIRRDVPIIYNNLALAQAGLHDADGAIASLKQALAIDPRMVEANNNLGALLFERKDYEGARRAFSQTLERDPSSTPARFNLARTLAAMNNHEAAVREYQTILQKSPNDAEARYYLALSYAAIGRRQEAAAMIEQLLGGERDPQRAAEMRQALERIRGPQ